MIYGVLKILQEMSEDLVLISQLPQAAAFLHSRQEAVCGTSVQSIRLPD